MFGFWVGLLLLLTGRESAIHLFLTREECMRFVNLFARFLSNHASHSHLGSYQKSVIERKVKEQQHY